MEITVNKLTEDRFFEVYELFQSYPDFFADNFKLDNFCQLHYYLVNKVTDVLIGVKNDKVIGCAYLRNLENGLGEVAIITRRKALHPDETVNTLQNCLHYYFDNNNLNFIYAITRVVNKAALRLNKALGFKGGEILKDYELVNGKFMDCVLTGLLRENLQ